MRPGHNARVLPEVFRPFSVLHGVTVAVCALLIAVACMLGRRWRGGAQGRRLALERWWGWSIVATQLGIAVWWLLPGHLNLEGAFNAERAVPLNLCRLVVLPAAVAMLCAARWSRAILYFWGLGLSTQAFVTPVFPEGPAFAVFWVFWLGHVQIVGTAVYDVVVRGFRPTSRDFRFAAALGVVYAGVVIAVNAWWRTNYGGLGPTTFALPNLARHLGDWPWRPGWIVLIALVWFVVLWRVWSWAARLGIRAAS